MQTERRGRRLARYYPNGQLRVLFEDELPKAGYGSVADWINYNRTFRFGCALFVDSVCLYPGLGISPDQLSKYAEQEKAALTPCHVDTASA